MIFPNDSLWAKCTQATATRCDLIATSTGNITILHAHMDKTAQASQLIQCSDGVTFKAVMQAITASPQDDFLAYVIPSGYSCYLKTFDNTLTNASILWVNRDIKASSSEQVFVTNFPTATTTASTTPTASILNGFTYGEMFNGFLLFMIFCMIFFGGIVKHTAGIKLKVRHISRNYH